MYFRKSKYYILKATKDSPELREKEFTKRKKMLRTAKIKEIIGYFLALCVLGGCVYAVLVVSANTDSEISKKWAKNFMTSMAQDMGVSQVIKVLITVALIKIIAKGQKPKTVKILRFGVDPIITRALALAFYKQ